MDKKNIALSAGLTIAATASGVALYKHYKKDKNYESYFVFDKELVTNIVNESQDYKYQIPTTNNLTNLGILCIILYTRNPSYYISVLRYLSFYGLELKKLLMNLRETHTIETGNIITKPDIERLLANNELSSLKAWEDMNQKNKGELNTCLAHFSNASTAQEYSAACHALALHFPRIKLLLDETRSNDAMHIIEQACLMFFDKQMVLVLAKDEIETLALLHDSDNPSQYAAAVASWQTRNNYYPKSYIILMHWYMMGNTLLKNVISGSKMTASKEWSRLLISYPHFYDETNFDKWLTSLEINKNAILPFTLQLLNEMFANREKLEKSYKYVVRKEVPFANDIYEKMRDGYSNPHFEFHTLKECFAVYIQTPKELLQKYLQNYYDSSVYFNNDKSMFDMINQGKLKQAMQLFLGNLNSIYLAALKRFDIQIQPTFSAKLFFIDYMRLITAGARKVATDVDEEYIVELLNTFAVKEQNRCFYVEVYKYTFLEQDDAIYNRKMLSLYYKSILNSMKNTLVTVPASNVETIKMFRSQFKSDNPVYLKRCNEAFDMLVELSKDKPEVAPVAAPVATEQVAGATSPVVAEPPKVEEKAAEEPTLYDSAYNVAGAVGNAIFGFFYTPDPPKEEAKK